MWRSRRMGQPEWQGVEEACWIAGGQLPECGAPQALAWLRGHGEGENRVC
ncbi:MAG: hypothetical protein NZ765_00625 [Anaerolineae bacterium]|nr:hypothetical protein [Anaerolineae bacterium]